MVECLVCLEEPEDALFYNVEVYAAAREPGASGWRASGFCAECVGRLLATQYGKFVADCVNSTCLRSLRRLMTSGPPVYVHDEYAFPEARDYSPVWLKHGARQPFLAKLHGAPDGPQRLAVWEELKCFVPTELVEPDKAARSEESSTIESSASGGPLKLSFDASED